MAGEVYYVPGDQDPTSDSLFEAVRGKVEIGVGTANSVPPECVALVLGHGVDPTPALDRVKALRFIQLTTCDNPHLDVLALDKRMVRVATIAPAVLDTVAQHTLGLAVAAMKLPGTAGTRSREEIIALANHAMTSGELSGTQIGLVGLGGVGAALARQLAGTGAKLVYSDVRTVSRQAVGSLGIRRSSLDLLLTQSEIVVLAARWGPTANPLIGQRELRLPDPGTLLVNAADRRLVDESALIAALSTGQLRGAAFGVAVNMRLSELPNVVTCPLSLRASDADAAAELIVSNLVRFANEEPVAGLIEPIDFPPSGDPAFWSSRLYPPSTG
jgi:phosphoglycerate dehydrogenase-like enzyme